MLGVRKPRFLPFLESLSHGLADGELTARFVKATLSSPAMTLNCLYFIPIVGNLECSGTGTGLGDRMSECRS